MRRTPWTPIFKSGKRAGGILTGNTQQGLNCELFEYVTTAAQQFVVPAEVWEITVTAVGATGGAEITETGGAGGLVTATFPVIPGTTFDVYAPSAGGPAVGSGASLAGWPGGGAGGVNNSGGNRGGSGGGYASLRPTGTGHASAMIVAAGGGGGGYASGAATGGSGGHGRFLQGQDGQGGPWPGLGATQTAGGGVTSGGFGNATPGSFGQGGNGGAGGAFAEPGGGGGGGWYGGGGANCNNSSSGAGGGGSGHVNTLATGLEYTDDYNPDGNGWVEICWRYSRPSVTLLSDVSVTDIIERPHTAIRTTTNTVGITDTVVTLLSQSYEEITDDIGITEDKSLDDRSDEIGITDTVEIVRQSILTVTDDVGITDAIERIHTAERILTDDVDITDTAVGSKAAYLTDDIGITDTPTPSRDQQRIVNADGHPVLNVSTATDDTDPLSVTGVEVGDLIFTIGVSANDAGSTFWSPASWSGITFTQEWNWGPFLFETSGSDSRAHIRVVKATSAGTLNLEAYYSNSVFAVVHVEGDWSIAQANNGSGAGTTTTRTLPSAPSGPVIGMVGVGNSASGATGSFDLDELQNIVQRFDQYMHVAAGYQETGVQVWTPSWSPALSEFGGYITAFWEIVNNGADAVGITDTVNDALS